MKKNVLLLLVLLFIVLNALFIVFAEALAQKDIDNEVLIVTNLLLFIISVLTHFMHVKALKNPNPNVFTRSVMAGTTIKLFVLGAAVLLYLVLAGDNRSIPAVFAAMGLYVIYTVVDVRSALSLNKKRNA